MNYPEAIEVIRRGGKVRLPEWTGYWFSTGTEILAFTRTGDVVSAWADSNNTTSHGLQTREDWQEVTTPGLGYDWAILALKDGKRVRRTGWNGKGMWLQLVGGKACAATEEVKEFRHLPWIGMKTADDCFVPWLASQTDMLCDDWELAA